MVESPFKVSGLRKLIRIERFVSFWEAFFGVLQSHLWTQFVLKRQSCAQVAKKESSMSDWLSFLDRKTNCTNFIFFLSNIRKSTCLHLCVIKYTPARRLKIPCFYKRIYMSWLILKFKMKIHYLRWTLPVLRLMLKTWCPLGCFCSRQSVIKCPLKCLSKMRFHFFYFNKGFQSWYKI